MKHSMALSTFNPHLWHHQKQLVHIKSNGQQSWGVHADNGFYMGPAFKHYWCYKVIMQHANTKRITNTILFEHHIPVPAVSATDCIISAIKQLHAITKHTVTEATNEEKAINTLWELHTAPTQIKSHDKTTLVPETTCPSTNIAAPHAVPLMPPAILHQTNLHQPSDNELEDTSPQHHQYNLQSRAHLIADSIMPSCRHLPCIST